MQHKIIASVRSWALNGVEQAYSWWMETGVCLLFNFLFFKTRYVRY